MLQIRLLPRLGDLLKPIIHSSDGDFLSFSPFSTFTQGHLRRQTLLMHISYLDFYSQHSDLSSLLSFQSLVPVSCLDVYCPYHVILFWCLVSWYALFILRLILALEIQVHTQPSTPGLQRQSSTKLRSNTARKPTSAATGKSPVRRKHLLAERGGGFQKMGVRLFGAQRFHNLRYVFKRMHTWIPQVLTKIPSRHVRCPKQHKHTVPMRL